MPPFLYTTLDKSGNAWGICSDIQFASWIHPLPPFLMMSGNLEYKRGQISRWLPQLSSLNVYRGNQWRTCLDNKPRDTEETCIVSGDRGRLHVSSCSQSVSINYLAVTSKRGYICHFVYTCLWTQSTMELNQNHIPRDARYWLFTWGRILILKLGG